MERNHTDENDSNERVIPSSSPIHSTMDIGEFSYVTPSRFLGTDEKITINNTTPKEYTNNNNNNINNNNNNINTSPRISLDEPMKRTSKLLKQLNSSAFLSDVDPLFSDLERRIEKMFNQKSFQTIFDQINKLLARPQQKNNQTQNYKTTTTYQTVEKSGAAGKEVDPSEPADRFVAVSRSLQEDKKLGGYSNFKEASKSRTSSHSHGPRGEQFFMETLFDSKTLLAAAALGLAFSFLPSSSPVPRSLFGRSWPHLLQIAIATIVHIRKTQDLDTDEPKITKEQKRRSNGALYIATAIVQVFTALRDIRGSTFVNFASRALFGPIGPLVGLIKQIIVAIPNFLLKTVLLSGISLLGKVTIFLTISVAIVVAIGVLIVTAAEYV